MEPTPPVERNGRIHPQNYPQGSVDTDPNHILDESEDAVHIWGVPILGHSLRNSYFSTPDGIYPQIIASYPQNGRLYNGFSQPEHPKYGRLFRISEDK